MMTPPVTKPKKSRIKDLTGQRFGRLVVIRMAIGYSSSNSRVKWLCMCDCGGLACVDSYKLRARLTRSCGCLQREASSRCLKATRSRQATEIKKIRDTGVKWCNCCKAIKDVGLFYKDASRLDGLSVECIECNKEKTKKYRLSDKGTLNKAKQMLKSTNIELPPELVEAKAELVKIRRTIKEMTK